jgi:hypothetical protein
VVARIKLFRAAALSLDTASFPAVTQFLTLRVKSSTGARSNRSEISANIGLPPWLIIETHPITRPIRLATTILMGW